MIFFFLWGRKEGVFFIGVCKQIYVAFFELNPTRSNTSYFGANRPSDKPDVDFLARTEYKILVCHERTSMEPDMSFVRRKCLIRPR